MATRAMVTADDKHHDNQQDQEEREDAKHLHPSWRARGPAGVGTGVAFRERVGDGVSRSG
jgi:hypothetical protein